MLPSAQKPHPSLVDAIYLLACYFSRSPSLTELEPHFLKRSLRGISEALQHSDRIVHVLQASCLLAVYFFWHGRTLEGYYHSSIAARLAVGLGLHQISSKENFRFQMQRASYQDAPAPLKASVPLSPPLDEVEYAERIAAFWQIFAVDRAWAVATGLPTALPDDDHPRSRITTIWPIVIPDDPEVRGTSCSYDNVFNAPPISAVDRKWPIATVPGHTPVRLVSSSGSPCQSHRSLRANSTVLCLCVFSSCACVMTVS